MSSKPVILSGDIGGTNSRFKLFSVEDASANKTSLVYREEFRNDNFDDFTSVVRQFLSNAGCSTPPSTACLAIAGPVEDDCAELTNRAWKLSGRQMEQELGISSVRLINDFVGNGYGLLTLEDREVHVIKKGDQRDTGPIVCVGAGTGLGECFLTASSSDANGAGAYTAWPGEGGHVDFAPRDQLEFELLQYLRKKFKGRVSYERVVSGIGFAHLYEFLRGRFPRRVDAEADAAIDAAKDKGAEICKYGMADKTSLCGLAVSIFLSAYGAEVGNCALKFLPRGGVFVCGGIANHMAERILDPDDVFLQAYHDKGRLSYVLESIPLKLVKEDDIGERGARWVALQTFKGGQLNDARGSAQATRGCPSGSCVTPLTAAAIGAGIAVAALFGLNRLK